MVSREADAAWSFKRLVEEEGIGPEYAAQMVVGILIADAIYDLPDHNWSMGLWGAGDPVKAEVEMTGTLSVAND